MLYPVGPRAHALEPCQDRIRQDREGGMEASHPIIFCSFVKSNLLVDHMYPLDVLNG